jgi:hypothetical protein
MKLLPVTEMKSFRPEKNAASGASVHQQLAGDSSVHGMMVFISYS